MGSIEITQTSRSSGGNRNSLVRYQLCPPVPGGYAFWAINDMKRMYALVTISKYFPDAGIEARRLYRKLRHGNRY